ncbi:phosphodiester glycosidase family protein [uncultured Roseobacter sp.]|uniref:phosphodiester glycosidase family protein n=1 Tax=uncultured Roseobacter sp. TaxID=114847 RepID=UPI0026380FED|nr:phosphodiester glycosidase family protein [uncultured Roseobacter sp.]
MIKLTERQHKKNVITSHGTTRKVGKGSATASPAQPSASTTKLQLLQQMADASLNVEDLQNVQEAADNHVQPKSQAPARVVQRYTDKDIENITKMQALIRRRNVQKQIRVQSEGKGIVGTRIKKPAEGTASVAGQGSPLRTIQDNLDQSSVYNQMRVLGGAKMGGVVGTGEKEKPQPVASLSADLPEGTAVINGGFFAHQSNMRSEEGWDPKTAQSSSIPDPVGAYYKHDELKEVGQEGVGRPVGPTSTRSDHLPIPSEYQDYYGQLNVGAEVGLSSGPLLALDGTATDIPDPKNDDRFKYRLGPVGEQEENPRNKQVGVMTHAEDRNARAAISVKGDDAIMHTVTPTAMRPNEGVTMDQWQQITMAGAGIRQEGGNPASGSTLNLDGGGSVYMGVTGESPEEMRAIAKGQRLGEEKERPVGNIIASLPDAKVRKDE